MFKVGLTGGIGCGKSTVSDLFLSLGVPIIDADDIAHQLIKPGQPAVLEIIAAFSKKLLNADGTLNRPLLREIVFSNPIEKQKLETILHPRVLTEIQMQSDILTNPYGIISIPLLFEAKMNQLVDRILVVDCPVEQQIDRVKQRSNLSETSVRSIIASQVSREFRLTHADDVIDNSSINSKLAEQVKKLHNLYMSISAATGKSSQ
ncbi:dephospho-CoA kinase [biofilm metagenome]